MTEMQVDYVSFNTRRERSEYIAAGYTNVLAGRVLDVGCDESHLHRLLPDLDYCGIDVHGSPDIRMDLESLERLPFDDDSFDLVVCSDVLEHLDNLHSMFGELVRVTARHVIVSLPNCWAVARLPIARGRGEFSHYGLPLSKPEDRHKWFFNITQAKQFILRNAETYGYLVMRMHVTEKPRPALARGARRLVYRDQERYLNRYAHTLWALLQKKPSGTDTQV